MERSPDPKVLTMPHTSQGLGTQKNGEVGLEDDYRKTKVNTTCQLTVGTRTNFVHVIATFDLLPV